MDAMKSQAKAFNKPLDEIKKLNLSGQWFSANPEIAASYASKLGKTKYVDVTPAEYEQMKRYKDKVNLTKDASGKLRYPVSTKEGYSNYS